jgi:DNA-binding response OmpR family regulator
MHPATSGVVLGLNMPVMNGWDTLAEMKASHIVMPVLAMSAYLPQAWQQVPELLRSGADFFLWKPFRDELFLEVVARVMETSERPIGCGWASDDESSEHLRRQVRQRK